jgi:hypothetical protein
MMMMYVMVDSPFASTGTGPTGSIAGRVDTSDNSTLLVIGLIVDLQCSVILVESLPLGLAQCHFIFE